ncbi:MAG: hypothetical protein Q4D51_08420 [Eubacteriales bacterium]|nr:hypothetical protein [Eubacteriales bacterium]
MAKKKTISGAMESIPNLSHNRREHIPPNSDVSRLGDNFIFRCGEFSLKQIYEKLFEESYQKWRGIQIKKSRGERAPATYYDKIMQDKKKKPLYEIIWQIGDMMDTGFDLNPEDAKKAEELLKDFMVYILQQPNICMVTEENMSDPDWEPPFESGLVIYEAAYHGDENSPHVHMTYIPYVRNMKRGCSVQNAFTKAFEGMGYYTKDAQATDKDGNLVWQTNEKGEKVAQKKRVSFGGVDWVEEQKMVLQAMMEERYGWERLYKGSNPRGNLLLSDYRREMAAKRAEEAELMQERAEFRRDFYSNAADREKEKLNEIKSEVEVEKRELAQTNQELRESQELVGVTKEELAEKQQEYVNVEQKVNSMTNTYKALSDGIDDYKRVMAVKMTDLEKVVDSIGVANQRLDELNTEITDKKRESESLTEDIDDSRAVLEKAKAEEQDAVMRAKIAIEVMEDKEANVLMLERKAQELERIAKMFANDPLGAHYELREQSLKIAMENEALKQENRQLRYKLEQAYEFMKQFTIKGKTILEMFLEKMEQVVERVFRR